MPSEQRREQLLDAVIAIIARDGYAGISIDAIAREVDVTRPVVYGVFDNLEQLLYALLDRQEQRAMAQLLEAMPDDLLGAAAATEPDSLILATVRRLAETVAGDPMTWRPILLAPEGTPKAVRERIERDRELVRRRIEGLLAAGLALRGVTGVDTEIASHAAIAAAEHFGRMLVAEPPGVEVDRLLSAIESLLAALGPA
jgi:AcrR family transcriptional regulator